jgi:nicotinamidase-related amidase
MPITSLDARTALVVIDLQKGIVAMAGKAATPVVEKARRLLDAFRRQGRPVVLVNVAGGAPGRAEQSRSLSDLPADWADLIPELDARPEDVKVTKHTWGAFTGTDLDAKLKALGVTQIVLAGVATSIGVESTARQAHELGYNVALALDAMTDLRREAHQNSVSMIFPRLGETGQTADIIALLEA